MVPGGMLGQRSPDLSGAGGLEQLLEWRFDLAVVGADALDPKRGEFYSTEGPTAALSRRAQERAPRIFLCVDHTKFGKQALAVAGRLEESVTLFTDDAVSGSLLKLVEQHGTNVVVTGGKRTRRTSADPS
jgi:DeoR/GlpR family transcriptional regulator of sugar metabolism